MTSAQVAGTPLVVVTPWYPTTENPMWGSFVRDAVQALTVHAENPVTIVHVDSRPPSPDEDPLPGGSRWSVRTEDRSEGLVHVIRAPAPSSLSRHGAITLHRAALAACARDLLASAEVVSAHVGGPSGAAVAPLLAPATRFTIVEHATYVRALFNDPRAAAAYRTAVERAAVVMAVSEPTAAVLRSLCPGRAEAICAVPNGVDVGRLALRAARPRTLDRWLFAGNLVARKRVDLLLRAFALEVEATGRQRPDLHLSIAGDGPLRDELTAQAERLAPGRVTFLGQVDPGSMGELYLAHDVLVHLAEHETFGLTMVEAAATGLPVVTTRAGGPDETMVVPEGLGMCVLVDRDPTDREVQEGVRSLASRVAAGDPAGSRAAMRALYGRERAADLQCRYVLGRNPSPPAAPDLELSVAVLYRGRAGWRHLLPGVRRCLDLGIRVVGVDLDRQSDPQASAGEDLRSLPPHELGFLEPAGRAGRPRRAGPPGLQARRRSVPAAVLPAVARLPRAVALPAVRAVRNVERVHRRLASSSPRRVLERLPRRSAPGPGGSAGRLLDTLAPAPDVIVLQRPEHALEQRLADRFPHALVHRGRFDGSDVARWLLQLDRLPPADTATP